MHAAYSVGIPAWVFPNVNIIDIFGLNDYVIARNPVPADHYRRMAHSRSAPSGYVESFRPNVTRNGTVTERSRPLTSDEIESLEAYWRVVRKRPGL